MLKARLETRFQIQVVKEGLKEHGTGEGCELLIVETKGWNLMDFCDNLLFTGFHLRWSSESGLFGIEKFILPCIQRPHK